MTRSLILGGARSGKSRYAEMLAGASNLPVLYVATARAGDHEMSARISLHRQQRNPEWLTLEEPLALGQLIAQKSSPECLILVDCMTIWLSNLLFHEAGEYPEVGPITPPACFHEQRVHFLQALTHAAGDIVLVSNEVGTGIVPNGAISRWFVDEAGRLNQELASICDHVSLVVAGLPLKLKG